MTYGGKTLTILKGHHTRLCTKERKMLMVEKQEDMVLNITNVKL